jgi:phage terminase large subunit
VSTPTQATRVRAREFVRAPTFHDDFLTELTALVLRLDTIQWPVGPGHPWYNDPVAFVREALEGDPLRHQLEFLRAVAGNEKVAIASGQKIGKTRTLIWCALWWYSTRVDARIILAARNEYQTQRVLWRELKKVIRKARLPIDGVLADQARTGLRAADLREMSGHTTKEAEAISGVSGDALLYLIDEASGLPQELGEAIEGNLASGTCKFVMVSNPTQTDGFFFDAFHEKKEFWTRIQISSEDVAREIGHRHIPGMANLEKLARWREEWGVESPFYQVRVLGRFLTREQGKVVSMALLSDALAIWLDTPDDEGDVLDVGLDIAGAGRDLTSFAFVRSVKLLAPPATFANLGDDQIIDHFFSLMRLHRKGRERVRLKLDAEGAGGAKMAVRFAGIAKAVQNNPDRAFEFYPVRSSLPALSRMMYGTIRDELYANLVAWLQAGGALPADPKLEAEIHFGEWHSVQVGAAMDRRTVWKAPPADDYRERLKRSPDRLASLLFAVYVPRGAQSLRPDVQPWAREEQNAEPNPFDVQASWQESPGYDPFNPMGGT